MSDPGHSLLHRCTWTDDDNNQIVGTEGTEQSLADRDVLANAFAWGTTTQRYYI